MSFMDSMRFFNVVRDDGDLLSTTPNDVLAGKIFVGKSKKFQIGEIPVLQNYTNISLSCGQSFTVAYGHNQKDYTIQAADLLSQTPGNMGEEDLLDGAIGWSNGVQIHGKMIRNEVSNMVLNSGESYLIPIGYHTGLGRVSVRSLAEQTIGNAGAEDILLGKIAWINGIEVAGTMMNTSPEEILLSNSEEYVIPEGYHHGTGKIIVVSLASKTPGTATKNDIVFGKTAWVNGEEVTGEILINTAQEIILPINGTYIIPPGIHSGLGKVTQRIDTLNGLTITPSFEDQTVIVKNKYMTNDITVTGIDALNFGRQYPSTLLNVEFDNGGDGFSGMNGETELGRIGVDNWHDNFTLNIYNIEVAFPDIPLGTMNCTVMIDSLINPYYSTDSMWNTATIYHVSHEDGTLDYMYIYVEIDSITKEHVFKISYDFSIDAREIGKIQVSIIEGPKFRKYGDSHDK